VTGVKTHLVDAYLRARDNSAGVLANRRFGRKAGSNVAVKDAAENHRKHRGQKGRMGAVRREIKSSDEIRKRSNAFGSSAKVFFFFVLTR